MLFLSCFVMLKTALLDDVDVGQPKWHANNTSNVKVHFEDAQW